MDYLSQAASWFHHAPTSDGGHVDTQVDAGAGSLHPQSHGNDLLGGLVGGFAGPMDWRGIGGGVHGSAVKTHQDGGYTGGHAGLGVGAGVSNWSGTEEDGTRKVGASTAFGGVAPVGVVAGNPDVQARASTNVYSGVGSSAYTFDKGDEHGAGISSTVVPLGLGHTNAGVDTRYGNVNADVNNAYAGRVKVDSTFSEENGVYRGASKAGVTVGVEGVDVSANTVLGNGNVKAGSVDYGVNMSAKGSYDQNTGAGSLQGTYADGLQSSNLAVSTSSADGKDRSQASVGSVAYGNSGQATLVYDPVAGRFGTPKDKDGGYVDTAQADLAGLKIDNLKASREIDGIGKVNVSAGEISNTTQIRDGVFDVSKDHARVGGSVDGMGIRAKNLAGDFDVGEGSAFHTTGGATLENIGTTNSVTKAFLDVDTSDRDNIKRQGGFEALSFGGVSANNFKSHIDGPGGSKLTANMDKFNEGLELGKTNVTQDNNGIAATMDKAEYNTTSIQGVRIGASDGQGGGSSLGIGELGINHASGDNLQAGLTRDRGLYASGDNLDYSTVSLKGHGYIEDGQCKYMPAVSAKQNLGTLGSTDLELGEGSFDSFHAKHAGANIDLNGIHANVDEAKYRYLEGKDMKVGGTALDGFFKSEIGAKQASFGGVDIGKATYEADARTGNIDVAADNVGAHGLRVDGLSGSESIGDLGMTAGADKLNVLDLNIGHMQSHTEKFGTKGTSSIDGANLDLLDVKNAHGGLSWDGQELAGVRGDYKASGGVDHASGNYDLLDGTANGTFTNAHYGQAMKNAHVNVLGTDFALPDAGFDLKANGGGTIDAKQGAMNGNVSLAGSTMNLGGTTLTAPEWAQANAGVNLQNGTANAQLGGDKGVGFSVAGGNVNVNAFGTNVNVNQAVSDGAAVVGNGFSTVGHGIADGVSTVGTGISNAWNSLPKLELPKIELPHIW